MKGRRLPDSIWPQVLTVGFDEYQDGDYWKVRGCPPSFDRHPTQAEGVWYVYYKGAAGIPRHKVIEHEDGTISVPPPGSGEPANSVLINGQGSWHGYINHGVWEAC